MKFEIYKKLFLLLLLFNIGVVHAERYMGDNKDSPSINNLMTILKVQQQELQRLMSMLTRLEKWKQSLGKKNTELVKESELAKQDKKKEQRGEITAEALNEKWHKSGRSLKHDHDLKSFREDVASFNTFVKDYNVLANKMNHVLKKRSPGQVTGLIKKIRELLATLKTEIDDGNIEKAKFIARQSKIAAEFGYTAN